MTGREALLADILARWAAGELYEAHERLEDLAEAVEDDERDHETALALVHVAACLHKLAHDVGAGAVPAKLERALRVLRGAEPGWLGLDLAGLVAELEALALRLAAAPSPNAAAAAAGGARPRLRRR